MERRRTKRVKYQMKRARSGWRKVPFVLLLALLLLPIVGTSPFFRSPEFDSAQERLAAWFLEQLGTLERGSSPTLEPSGPGGAYLPVLEPSYAALQQRTQPERIFSALWPWQIRSIDGVYDGRFVDTLEALQNLPPGSEDRELFAALLRNLSGLDPQTAWDFLGYDPTGQGWSAGLPAPWREYLEQGGSSPSDPPRQRPAYIAVLPFLPPIDGGPIDDGPGGGTVPPDDDGKPEGPPPTKVPEPGAWILLLVGAFSLVGLLRIRRA